MRSLKPFLPLAASLALAACGGDDTPDSCLPDCAATRGYDAQAYNLHARFDWDAQKLVASEDVTLAPASAAPADAIVELDAALDVKGVHAATGKLAYAYDADKHTLHVDLTPLEPATGALQFTVDYEAPASDSLIPALPLSDDPVKSRALYTDSEPNRGHQWLVEKDDPSDRALFSVDVTVASDEDVIANGKRVSDATVGGERKVGYALDKPIPTYLMAFCAGQIEHTDRTGGRVPLSLWYRRDLAVRPDDNLDAVADAMASFEKLVGPYPWDSYSVVLVPQYGGGMENATITFNAETSGQGNVGFNLNAHELGHHWFGDWVTMHGYDDVWMKEGMATLLAAEADRARRDRQATGRLFGSDFDFDPTEAVVDPMLHGLDKYTSGPYERAAWTLTQIRAKIGEDAFWGALRKVLADHELGTIDSESFVRAFAPALDEASIQQVLASLQSKDAPSFVITSAPNASNAADTDVTIDLTDTAKLLLAPIGVTVVDAAGQATSSQLVPGTPLTLTVPAGGYIAPDEADVHPYWTSSFNDAMNTYSLLVPLLVPPPGPALTTFEARSPSTQERALAFSSAAIAPDQLGAYVDALDSDTARRGAIFDACGSLDAAAGQADVQAQWATALTPLVKTPVQQAFSTRYGTCGVALADAALGDELTNLVGHLTVDVLGRLEYVMSFDFGPAKTLQLIGTLTDITPSQRLRDLAFSRLAFQAKGFGYTAVTAADAPAYESYFRQRLQECSSQSRFMTAWGAEIALADVGAPPIAAERLHDLRLSAGAQRQIVCDVFHLAASNPTLWTAFQAAAQPWDTLSMDAQTVLATPSGCDM